MRAKANHDGTFVWGDSTNADVASTGTNQFMVRANGGLDIFGGSYRLRLRQGTDSSGRATANVVAGYSGNSVAGEAWGATIAGGGNEANANSVSADHGSVGGGIGNTASGYGATAPGGYQNVAQGQYSLAAGRMAKAWGDGCFVWGDSSGPEVGSTGINQFIVQAGGGVIFYSRSDLTKGVRLDNSATSWTGFSSSDRALKHSIHQMDGREVLSKLTQIPISRWTYKSDAPRVEHIGPMSQDFYAAFGVGGDDKHIDTIDADGVALAAIQGLYAVVKEKEAENAALREKVDALESRLAEIEVLMESLK